MPCPPKHPEYESSGELTGTVPRCNEPDMDVKSPIEGIVVDWDLESPKIPGDLKLKVDPLPKRRCRSQRCCLFSFCISLVCITTCAALFWPRDPEWKLHSLDVLTEDAMMFFVMSFAGGMDSINENSTFPDLGFYAKAEVSNPNLLGGVADSGHFQILFRGQEIGTATSPPISVQPQSSALVGANSTVRLNYHLFHALTTEVLANELKLSLQVKGAANVEGPLGIRLLIRLECTIHCAVEKLFDPPARNEVVQSKECQYKYF